DLYWSRFPYLYASDPRDPSWALKMDPNWSSRVHFPQGNAALGYVRAALGSGLRATWKADCLATIATKVFEPDHLARLLIPGPNLYGGSDVTRVWRGATPGDGAQEGHADSNGQGAA